MSKLTFRVNESYRVVAWKDPEYGSFVRFYIEKNWNGRFYIPEEDKPGEGEFVIEGSIKFDGCCNWQSEKDCMAHICGWREMKVVAECFRVAYILAQQLSPSEFRGDPGPLPREWKVGDPL